MTANQGPIVLKREMPGGGGGGGPMRGPERPYGARFWQLNNERAHVVDSEDMEVCPMLIGEQSPVKTDHDMQTTIPGLFAVGDVSYCGSAAPGAVPAPSGTQPRLGHPERRFRRHDVREGGGVNSR